MICSKIVKLCQFFSTFKLPKHEGITLVFEGNQHHFQIIKGNKDQIKRENNKIFLYQREPIDLAYQMIKQNVKILTYITPSAYETIEAKKIDEDKEENEVEASKLEQKIKEFLNRHDFIVKKTFLDLHPLEAYHKVCTFMGAQKKKQDLSIFKHCTFSKQQIKQNTIFLPFTKSLWKQYLKTDSIKLKKLDRIRAATQSEVNQAINKWKSIFQVPETYSTTSQQQKFKINFAIEHKIGRFVKIQNLLEGEGQKSYYAKWN